MSFRITGLQAAPFRHLFWLPEVALAAHGAQRWMATGDAALPDRVELRDAEAGETLLLVNYEHQPAATPYRSAHAIFVLEGARQPYDRIDAVPKALSSRMLSLRAFDHRHLMVDAALVDGHAAGDAIEHLFKSRSVDYIHAHYATRGCYAARVDRA